MKILSPLGHYLSLVLFIAVIIISQQVVVYQITMETKINRELGHRMEAEIDAVKDNSAHNRVLLDKAYQRTSDRWTGDDHRRWANELKRLNPTLVFPREPFWKHIPPDK